MKNDSFLVLTHATSFYQQSFEHQKLWSQIICRGQQLVGGR